VSDHSLRLGRSPGDISSAGCCSGGPGLSRGARQGGVSTGDLDAPVSLCGQTEQAGVSWRPHSRADSEGGYDASGLPQGCCGSVGRDPLDSCASLQESSNNYRRSHRLLQRDTATARSSTRTRSRKSSRPSRTIWGCRCFSIYVGVVGQLLAALLRRLDEWPWRRPQLPDNRRGNHQSFWSAPPRGKACGCQLGVRSRL